MANKTLNTRIKLRYDSYENWLSKNPVLLAGEVAFATIEENKDGVQNAPSVLIKVGDGTSEYKSLKFVSALAADVLEACKSEAGLTAFVNGVIADAGIATNEAMQALAGRVTTVEGQISTAEGKISTIEGQISTLNGTGAGSVAKAIADAIAVLDLANTYEAKGEAAKVESALNTYKEANDIALAGVKATAEAAYVKPVAGISKSDLAADVQLSLGKADTALQSHQDISHLAVESSVASRLAGKVDNDTYTAKVGEIEGALATKAVKTEVEGALAGKVDKVEGKSLIADSEIARLLTLNNYDDTQVKADIAKKADAATMTTELGKKVDKKDGFSLVADAEIARLAEVDNYDDTEVRGLISDNADAIADIAKDYVTSAGIANFETKENVKKVADDLAAYVASNNEAVANRYTKAEADAKFALIADAYDDSALVARVEAIEADYLVEADKEVLEGAIADVDAKFASYNTTAVQKGIDDAQDARIKAIEDDYLKAADKQALQAQIDTIMSNPDAEGAINSINEFAQYVKDHGTVAEGFRADINKNKEDIAAAVKAIGDQATADAAKFETKDDAVAKLAEAKSYADGLNTAMDARVAELEAVDFDAYVAADEKVLKDAKDYVDGKDSAMNTRVLALEGINHNAYVAADAALKTELQGEIDSDIAAAKTAISAEIDADVKVVNDALEAYKTANNTEVAKKANDADLKAVAKSGLIDDLSIGEGTVLIFDCGNAGA